MIHLEVEVGKSPLVTHSKIKTEDLQIACKQNGKRINIANKKKPSLKSRPTSKQTLEALRADKIELHPKDSQQEQDKLENYIDLDHKEQKTENVRTRSNDV